MSSNQDEGHKTLEIELWANLSAYPVEMEGKKVKKSRTRAILEPC